MPKHELISDSEVFGKCYCEAVTFRIESDTPILLNGYCQCSDCRRAHAANLYQYAYILEKQFSIESGEKSLKWHVKDPSLGEFFRRYFCSECGTRTHNFCVVEFGGVAERLIGVFPSLFEDQDIAKGPAWAPKEHINSGESILDLACLHDGLPRYENVPTRPAL